jgi:hypothetical protein
MVDEQVTHLFFLSLTGFFEKTSEAPMKEKKNR